MRRSLQGLVGKATSLFSGFLAAATQVEVHQRPGLLRASRRDERECVAGRGLRSVRARRRSARGEDQEQLRPLVIGQTFLTQEGVDALAGLDSRRCAKSSTAENDRLRGVA